VLGREKMADLIKDAMGWGLTLAQGTMYWMGIGGLNLAMEQGNYEGMMSTFSHMPPNGISTGHLSPDFHAHY